MSFWGKAAYHADANNGWENFSNDVPVQEDAPIDFRGEEWAEICLHAVKAGGRYDWSEDGLEIRYRRVTKVFRHGDVNDAWEFIGGAA